MNTNPDLDVEHITGVCQAVATRPSTLRASGPEVTLLLPAAQERDRAHRALTRVGYTTDTGVLAGVHPNGIRVTGWSDNALERRAANLRTVNGKLDDGLPQTARRTIDVLSVQPTHLDASERTYAAATAITGSLLTDVHDRAGPLVGPPRPPADPDLADHLRTVQRLSDRATALLGDHFNTACVTADTYTRLVRERPERTARDMALAEANAFISDRIDPDALVDALVWARRHHPADSTAFAQHYARADREGRPPPDAAYVTWRGSRTSAARVASADFPEPPTTAPAAAPRPADHSPSPNGPGRSPRGPR